jgi:hypothetical protein
MKKARSAALLLAAVCCFMFLAVASTGDDDAPARDTNGNAQQGSGGGGSQQQAADERFTLNQTAVFRNISVTAEEIIVNDDWETQQFAIFKPSEGNKFVAVKFTIENTSDEDQSMSTILLFDAYADGVKLEYSFGAASGLTGTLDGNVSPGRRLVGYYGVEVSENAKELELEVKPSWLGTGKAVFVFAMP